MSATGKVIQVSSSESGFRRLLKTLIPPLSFDAHKGQHGRVGIIGGSVDFTGAPYYAGAASLKLGGDLAFIFSAKEAVIPIKSYSPELMVTPFYEYDKLTHDPESELSNKDFSLSKLDTKPKDEVVHFMANKVVGFLPRLHALVIGPGMGREPQVMEAIMLIIKAARSRQLPLVLDADALWMLTQGDNMLSVTGCVDCVLTPNRHEFHNLIHTAIRLLQQRKLGILPRDQSLLDGLSSSYADVQLRALSSLLQCTILLKGPQDLVCSGIAVESGDLHTANIEHRGGKGDTLESNCANVTTWSQLDVYQVSQVGSPRRCGGQGDVLSGVLGVSLHWARMQQQALAGLTFNIQDGDNTDASARAAVAVSPPPAVLASILASMVTRQAAQYAFQDKRRSMTTPDMLSSLGTAFESIIDENNLSSIEDEFY